jgi:hypothetical protein
MMEYMGDDIEPTSKPRVAQSTAAARMRRCRERRREGLRCVTVELRETEIDALVRKGLLTAEHRNEPQSILQALYEHLDSSFGSKA